ncbi:PREDICTED: amine sulfotransferase-like [Amphimedon queenslandica]|uniref:Sulfotransferase domain-containing protein n=1 Tax=Amphimedon queenslandica TaxID=400682 RepID=A0AAN0JYE5_AMPQE|nr:PREDICTED: amine sulfotransferase-like [Amphimedon queenslandica]|eukprot:XP_019861985.1 PREDICTED: amine sulfotransferase-like [Amphimedon queenslandica]
MFLNGGNIKTNAKNILFLMYEDLKKDLSGSVKTIAQFMGYSLDDAMNEKVTRQCTFDSMTVYLRHSDTREVTVFNFTSFIGNWKNHLSDEHSARFDTLKECQEVA